jgi:intracellular septation protein
MAASFAQIGWLWFKGRKIDTMLWVSLVVITVFGGMTLLLQDEDLHQVEADGALLGVCSGAARRHALLQEEPDAVLLAEQMELPDAPGAKVNWSWVGFFIFMGIANLFVAFNFSTDDWVNFKLFGATGLMLVFVVAQGLLLSKYIEETK